MALSDLIHKPHVPHVATATVATPATHQEQKPPTVANVASVAVANPQESKIVELWVVCYTPLGKPMTVKANDVHHAEKLIRMNPKPKTLNGVIPS